MFSSEGSWQAGLLRWLPEPLCCPMAEITASVIFVLISNGGPNVWNLVSPTVTWWFIVFLIAASCL